jgi:hypothetical protein
MGDRANIVIRVDQWSEPGEREAVFLYGHWSGYDLPETLRKALAKRWRWDDGPYLARIVFDEMTADAHGDETGYGISTRIPDNEHDLLVLRIKHQCLTRLPQDAYAAQGFNALNAYPSISFADYIAAPERTWDNLTDVLAAA